MPQPCISQLPAKKQEGFERRNGLTADYLCKGFAKAVRLKVDSPLCCALFVSQGLFQTYHQLIQLPSCFSFREILVGNQIARYNAESSGNYVGLHDIGGAEQPVGIRSPCNVTRPFNMGM